MKAKGSQSRKNQADGKQRRDRNSGTGEFDKRWPFLNLQYVSLVQSVERKTVNLYVVGSSPTRYAKSKEKLKPEVYGKGIS